MAKKLQARKPISLPDYERVFRVIHGVLLNEIGSPAHACLYFGVLGAAILKAHHRMDARPVVGAAGYNFGIAGQQPLVYAGNDGHASEQAFHCWVEADGWALDFQAPIFRESLATIQGTSDLPRWMMQKALNEASSFSALNERGSYWYEPHDDLARHLFGRLYQKASTADFERICAEWYKPSPKKLQPSIKIANQHGDANDVPLSQLLITGAW